MKNMKNLIVTLFLAIPVITFSQTVTGLIKDDQDKPLPSASITLHRAKDSAIVKIGITTPSGEYQFTLAKPGNYFITVSHTSYYTKRSPAFEAKEGEGTKIPDIILEKAVASLQDVTVTSKKPIVEVKADKTILNVENTINAVGSDALELLRKSPGVLVDKDENVSLAGKTGVQIYVDGSHPR